MRYFGLATDYDGTLATHGTVLPETLAALRRLRASGRKVILVTGREIPELLTVFPELELCDWVVGENGAVLYRPADRELKLLAPAPPAEFVAELRRRGVERISVGHVIVATWEPYETVALEVIRDLGLELHVIFNKGAVMVLPANVNKASGLKALLKVLELSPHELVGVGDAENDHSFLRQCEFSVAVANAIPALQEQVDWVTSSDHGAGVVELIDQLVAHDLAELDSRVTRNWIPLGVDENGDDVRINPRGVNFLFLGEAAGWDAACGLVERWATAGYQFCAVDPAGAAASMAGAVTFGAALQVPTFDEIMQLLAQARQNALVRLAGLDPAERPAFFGELWPRLRELRNCSGRPHWILVNSAEQVLPAVHGAPAPPPEEIERMLFVTSEPKSLAPAVLDTIGVVIAADAAALQALQEFAQLRKLSVPDFDPAGLEAGDLLLWLVQEESAVRLRLPAAAPLPGNPA